MIQLALFTICGRGNDIVVVNELLVSKRSQVGWRESFLKLVWFGVVESFAA